jgi:hypothetical protein
MNYGFGSFNKDLKKFIEKIMLLKNFCNIGVIDNYNLNPIRVKHASIHVKSTFGAVAASQICGSAEPEPKEIFSGSATLLGLKLVFTMLFGDSNYSPLRTLDIFIRVFLRQIINIF